MQNLVHDLVFDSADRFGAVEALCDRNLSLSYPQFANQIDSIARAFSRLGLQRRDRLAIYLPKQLETAISMFATNLAGGVFVPVNPVLKANQVQHILNDCNVRVLVTSNSRIPVLETILSDCHDLHTVIVLEQEQGIPEIPGIRFLTWNEIREEEQTKRLPDVIDMDMAAILYTSGSTGKPKGVVLSHRNIVTGAKSVAEYLRIKADDRILAVLPFSFDYGLNQMIASVLCGASCILMDYLLPRDVIRAVASAKITGLAAVPPLWVQLAQIEWPESINTHLRYLTNSGGKMPETTLKVLRAAVPNAEFFLMYGLTEAFRSTYLPPELIDAKPGSIGKAIPNAEILVVREDGSPCGVNEPGELVHRGSLVAMGYWNDPAKTAERFKPCPSQLEGLPMTEIAVWSGDTVVKDEEGYLYFVGRRDDMIKTSGYRVSPTEVEEVIYKSGLAGEAAVLGIPHPALGQAIVVAASPPAHHDRIDQAGLISFCKQELPNFMVPLEIREFQSLPR
ncbi:MAG: acyl-CoA ligase (AMP-forming), exosortase A system-associated, partial [Methylococcales bacterium]